MNIHPTAVVSDQAELGYGVKIGPYSHIGSRVVIGDNTEIGAHVVIDGHTIIGERNEIHPFTSLGGPPQDISYKGENTRLLIGNDNIIREYVTVNRASTKEKWETIIGNKNYIMAYAHVAHDCVLGDNIVMTNSATLAGHITVGDHVNFGGFAAVHQFVRIGAHAFIGGMSGVERDVPPFMFAMGYRANLIGLNRKGLSRRGFSQKTIDGLKKAHRIIWRENRNLDKSIMEVRETVEFTPELETLLNFLKDSKRGIMR